MRVIIQRVHNAHVIVEHEITGSIEKGLLVYVCVEERDEEKSYQWIINKLLKMRIFNDEQGNMNKSVCDVEGDILLISNFTLKGDAKKGNRPSFSSGISVEDARKKYEDFLILFRNIIQDSLSLAQGVQVEAGVFAAHMDVYSEGNGPINIILDSPC